MSGVSRDNPHTSCCRGLVELVPDAFSARSFGFQMVTSYFNSNNKEDEATSSQQGYYVLVVGDASDSLGLFRMFLFPLSPNKHKHYCWVAVSQHKLSQQQLQGVLFFCCWPVQQFSR